MWPADAPELQSAQDAAPLVAFDLAAGPDTTLCCRFLDGELQSLDVIDYDDEVA
jgi:hypothetical protein